MCNSYVDFILVLRYTKVLRHKSLRVRVHFSASDERLAIFTRLPQKGSNVRVYVCMYKLCLLLWHALLDLSICDVIRFVLIVIVVRVT